MSSVSGVYSVYGEFHVPGVRPEAEPPLSVAAKKVWLTCYSKELSVRNRTLSGSQPVSKKLRHQPANF